MSDDKPQQGPKIEIQEVYKIFGPDPDAAMQRVKQGVGKDELLDESGHTIGLRDISLDIQQGETFVVMGLSGSGKSTLIRHINRLIEPTSGRILVDGDDVLQMNEQELLDLRRHQMSMVFQRFALLPHKTVLDNTAYGLELAGVDQDEAHERARKQIDLVGLSGVENQFPKQLSGGMQQRVGLARALATDADILLMDEAFSALDPLIRTDMQDQLLDLQHNLHKTIVFITHDLDEALKLGDHIAILKDGELRQFGGPEEILLHPADDYVTSFVQDVNRGRVVTVGSICTGMPTLGLGEATRDAARRALEGGRDDAVYVLDGDGRPAGVITAAVLEAATGDDWLRDRSNLAECPSTGHRTVIEQMLPMVDSNDVPVAVVDAEGRFVGAVSRHTAIGALAKSPEELRAEAEAERGSSAGPAAGDRNQATA